MSDLFKNFKKDCVIAFMFFFLFEATTFTTVTVKSARTKPLQLF